MRIDDYWFFAVLLVVCKGLYSPSFRVDGVVVEAFRHTLRGSLRQ